MKRVVDIVAGKIINDSYGVIGNFFDKDLMSRTMDRLFSPILMLNDHFYERYGNFPSWIYNMVKKKTYRCNCYNFTPKQLKDAYERLV